MSDNNRTSVYLDEENYEYVKRTDLSFSELLNEAINRRRLAAAKSRPEQLEEEINDREEDLEEAKQKVRAIEADIQELRNELELYEEGERDIVDDLIEAAELAVNVSPEDRDHNRLPMAENAGLTPEQLAEAVDYADVHSVDPVAFATRDRMEEMEYYNNDERLVVPEPLVEDGDDEVYSSDVPSHWKQLTDEQEEALREWAQREI